MNETSKMPVVRITRLKPVPFLEWCLEKGLTLELQEVRLARRDPREPEVGWKARLWGPLPEALWEGVGVSMRAAVERMLLKVQGPGVPEWLVLPEGQPDEWEAQS